MLAGAWQEHIKRASVSLGMLARMRQERMKTASVSLGMVAVVWQECIKRASVIFGVAAEIADFRGLVLVPLSGLKRPPPNFSLIVRLLLLLEWPLLICVAGEQLEIIWQIL